MLVGEKLIAAGDKAVGEKDYETAYTNYLDALDAIAGGAGTKNCAPDSLQVQQIRFSTRRN